MGKAGKPNITTLAWAMPTSINPPLLAISLAQHATRTRLSGIWGVLVNIPTLEILQAVYAYGSLTGRSFDKFKKANLTQMPAKRLKPRQYQNALPISMQCGNKFTTGDHTVYVRKILEAYADIGYIR